MNRSELIEQLAARFPQFTKSDIDMAVRAILDEMASTIVRGGRVEVRGFGSFGLNYRPPRKGRNPKSGVSVMVPAKYVPHFKAGKDLRDRVAAASM